VIVDDYQVVEGKEGRGEWLPRKTAGLLAEPNTTVVAGEREREAEVAV
jgi:hypothetical protein